MLRTKKIFIEQKEAEDQIIPVSTTHTWAGRGLGVDCEATYCRISKTLV